MAKKKRKALPNPVELILMLESLQKEDPAAALHVVSYVLRYMSPDQLMSTRGRRINLMKKGKEDPAEIVRKLPTLEEDSDTRTAQEKVADFLADFQALSYDEEFQLLATTPSDLLIASIADFAAELERRMEDSEDMVIFAKKLDEARKEDSHGDRG